MEIQPLGAEWVHVDGQTNKKKLRCGLIVHICVFAKHSCHTSVSINASVETPVWCTACVKLMKNEEVHTKLKSVNITDSSCFEHRGWSAGITRERKKETETGSASHGHVCVQNSNTSTVSSQMEELPVFTGTQISRTLATAVVCAS